MKKERLVFVSIVVLVVVIFIVTNYLRVEAISPSEAHEICYRDVCSNQSVVIHGNMAGKITNLGTFEINDGNKTVYVDLRQSNISFLNALLFHEKNKLEFGEVIIEAEGRLKYNCNSNSGGCSDTLNLIVNPGKTKVIKKVGCFDNESGKINESLNYCFNYKRRTASEAFKLIQKSKICNQSLMGPTGDIEYIEKTTEWRFGMVLEFRGGGYCGTSCYVSDDKIKVEGTCVNEEGSYDEEEI